MNLGEGGEVLAGEAARQRLGIHPERTAARFKHGMGTARLCRLGDREFRPEELSSLVLRALSAAAGDSFLGGDDFEEAVMD